MQLRLSLGLTAALLASACGRAELKGRAAKLSTDETSASPAGETGDAEPASAGSPVPDPASPSPTPNTESPSPTPGVSPPPGTDPDPAATPTAPTTPDAPSPHVDVYGPVDPIGPQAGVTAPAGALVVTPQTANLSSLIGAQPVGKTIFFVAGSYTNLTFPIAPKNQQTFLAEAGAVIVNSSASPTIYSESSDITIQNLTFDGGGPEFPQGLIIATHSWVVKNVEIRNAHAVAVMAYDQSKVLSSYIHNYGQTGVHGSGTGVQVIGCDIGIGNQASAYPVNVEVGSVKLWGAIDGLVESNFLHDNVGPGLWFDGTQNSVAKLNHSVKNSRAGLYSEVSRGIIFADNLIENNGFDTPGNALSMTYLFGSGVWIETSYDVQVANNTLSGDANEIGIIATKRAEVTEDWEFRVNGLPFTGDIRVTDNNVKLTHAGARVGLIWDSAGGAPNPFVAGNLEFSSNAYTANSGTGFAWNPTGSMSTTPLSLATWQGLGNQ